MDEKISLYGLEEHLIFFNKMYDIVRLVDPLEKKVVEYKGCKSKDINEVCYDYWSNDKICDNCISIRSYNEDKSFMKIEQGKDIIMMVTAIPIETTEKPVVLELLKDATDSMMIGMGNYSEGKMMYDVVSSFNEMIVKDSLTAIYNRRFIEERLPVDIIKAVVDNTPLSVVFIDVDNLKEINDKYGHDIGDVVLREVSKTIDSCIRSHDDWVARYGGDEFLISLNNTNEEEASKICYRIRESVERVKVLALDKDMKITLSLGIYTMKDEKLTAEEIIKLADNKMYEEKRKRNKKRNSNREKYNLGFDY